MRRDAGRVVGTAGVELDRAAEIERLHDHTTVGARSVRDVDLAVDRDREAEPLLVVGVIPDEVHAPGCAPHTRRRPDRLDQRVKSVPALEHGLGE